MERATAVEARIKEGGRRAEDATSYGIGHRIRIEVLAALHEGPATASQLEKILRQPLSRVFNHIRELLADGSIEIARYEKRGNHELTYYRMVALPFFSEEAVAEMTAEERQVTAALILQASEAEALAALWAGKMYSDPRVMLAWNRITLDEQGRQDLADEQERSWGRIMEIEAESANRRASTSEPGRMYIVTSYGYERHRSAPPEPLAEGLGEEPRKS